MSGAQELPEWMVEFPASRNPEITRRQAYTFYEESEARDFMRGLGDLPGVVLSRRTITVGDWEVSS